MDVERTNIFVKTPLGRPKRIGENNITIILRKWGAREWSGFKRPRIGTSGGLL
jgi:hypothetical protein